MLADPRMGELGTLDRLRRTGPGSVRLTRRDPLFSVTNSCALPLEGIRCWWWWWWKTICFN